MWKVIIPILAIVGFLIGGVHTVEADHNPNNILPGLPTKVQLRAWQTGEIKYAFADNVKAYPRFMDQARAAFAAEYEELRLEYREVNPAFEVPDVWITAPSDATFTSICGAGAAACVTYANDPIYIYYRISLGYYDWGSTHTHEIGHIDGQHEMYKDSGGIQCLPQNTFTRMSCGTGVKRPTFWFDHFHTWWVHVPDLPSFATTYKSNGFIFVQSNGCRADDGAAHYGNKNLDNATQIAYFFRDNGGPWIWTGYGGAAATKCGTMIAERGFETQYWCAPNREWGVRPVNGWTWDVGYVSGYVKPAGFC